MMQSDCFEILSYFTIISNSGAEKSTILCGSLSFIHFRIKAEFCSRATYWSAKSAFYWQMQKNDCFAYTKLCTMFGIISYLRRDLKENNCILITWVDTRFDILHYILWMISLIFMMKILCCLVKSTGVPEICTRCSLVFLWCNS